MTKRALVTAALTVLVTGAVSAELPDKVSPYVAEQMSGLRSGTVRVEVYLENPSTKERLSEAEFNQFFSAIDQAKVKEAVSPLGAVMELTPDEISALALHESVKHISPYIELHPVLDDVIPIIAADHVHGLEVDGIPLTGEGYTIAVVDTGADLSHPYLADHDIIGWNIDCYVNLACPANPDFVPTLNHGTHVSGITVANGELFTGVAKDANVISINVFPHGGATTNSFLMIAAMSWALEHAEQYNIAVITLSIASTQTFPNDCNGINPTLAGYFQQAADQGIPVTIATGNSGSEEGVSYPACMDGATPIGATNKNDTRAGYSNYDESQMSLFAPGTSVFSTCFGDSFCQKSGTSMATPAVAGAMTLLRQAADLTGQAFTIPEMEDLLFATGDEILSLPFEDFRRINIANAIKAIDNLAPEIVLIAPEDSAEVSKGPVYRFACEASDWNDLDYLTLIILDSKGTCVHADTMSPAEQQVRHTFMVPGDALEPGTYTWSCVAADALGNTGVSETHTLTVAREGVPPTSRSSR